MFDDNKLIELYINTYNKRAKEVRKRIKTGKREKEKERKEENVAISVVVNESVRGIWNVKATRECRMSGGKTREWKSSRHISHRANNGILKRSPFCAWIYIQKNRRDPWWDLRRPWTARGWPRGLIHQWCLMAEFHVQKGGRLGGSHCHTGQI